jgi:hypothetical protein
MTDIPDRSVAGIDTTTARATWPSTVRCGSFWATCAVAAVLSACSGPRLPAPNSVDAHYDSRGQAIQLMVSGLQPPAAAELVSETGERYPASGISIVSAPHVLYNPPPSIGIGIGGFGISGCCSGFGSGVGVDLPLGGPRPSQISDQYVASALIPVPADYAIRWSHYHLEVWVGGRPMTLTAPPPSAA